MIDLGTRKKTRSSQTARLFVRHGAKVVIRDIRDDLGRSVAASIGADDVITYVHCGVAVEDDVARAVDLAVDRYGGLDIVFNNAWTSAVEASEVDRVLGVNVTGVFLEIKHAARAMMAGPEWRRRRGSIINCGSVGTVIGSVATHAYVASKHAVAGLTKSAAAELGQHGIRVNCISPFGYATALACEFMGRDGRWIEELIGGVAVLKGAVLRAEDAAQAAVFLGSDESSFVSGHDLVIDGGFTTGNNAFGLFN